MYKLHENIRKYRKERQLTQAQLAETINVSVGVISKWEIGLSCPDIRTIVSLAELYGISIDVLVGHQLNYANVNELSAQINNYLKERNFDDCIATAEAALRKYPNDYELVLCCANAYLNIGGAKHIHNHLLKSLELFELALQLHDPSTHKLNDRIEIGVTIAKLYVEFGNIDRSISYLIKNNFLGVNDDLIGYYLAKDKHKDAYNYLDKGFLSCIDSLFRICVGYSVVFSDNGNYDSALDVLDFIETFWRGIKKTNEYSLLDKSNILLLCEFALVYARQQKTHEAKSVLIKAINIAKEFDKSPNYSFECIRFINSKDLGVATDDFGETAMSGIRHFVHENDNLTSGVLSSLLKELDVQEI